MDDVDQIARDPRGMRCRNTRNHRCNRNCFEDVVKDLNHLVDHCCDRLLLGLSMDNFYENEIFNEFFHVVI